MTLRGLHGARLAVAGAASLMACMLSVAATMADEARLIALGKRLAGECTSCHKADGADAGIPSIVGWRTREFVMTMEYYQRGDRRHQVMNSVAQSLDGEQLEALAAYFGSLPRPPRKTEPAPAPK